MRKIDPEKQQAKRRQIVAAAVECFARSGFHATSTAEICAAAGMSPGNLFHYFDSKSAIIEAIALEDQREVAKFFAGLPDTGDAIAAIQQIAAAALEQATDPVYARISIEIAAEATRNPEITALFAINGTLVKSKLIGILKRGIANGQIDPGLNPALAATWLIALTDGAIGRAVMDPAFKPKAHAPMLQLMIRRFLQPQSS